LPVLPAAGRRGDLSVADRLNALSAEQRALLDALRRAGGKTAPPPPPVLPVSGPRGLGPAAPVQTGRPADSPSPAPPASRDWPLSCDQERLWRLHQQDPGLVSWNVDAASRVRGVLDLPAFAAAVHELVWRHAAWRATFPLAAGKPVQRVADELAPAMALLDLSALPAARREAAGRRALYEHTRQPFDLARGPLMRMALVRLGQREHLYLLTLHHLVTDWITFQIFFGELLDAYERRQAPRAPRAALAASAASAASAALAAGSEPEAAPRPPGLPLQFPDYAVWEREWLQGEVLAAETAFWQRQLAGFPLVLDLPADRPRPAVQSQRGGMLRLDLGADRAARLRALARAEGVTTFMMLLAALYALLWRVTGETRLVVGSNSANRPRPELAGVAGFFLTQVPFACDLGGDPTFAEVLARTRRCALAAYGHQSLPFGKLIEAVLGPGAAADRGRHPVVQVMLLVLPPGGAAGAAGLVFEPLMLYDGNSRWDLMLGLYDDPAGGIAGSVEYNADIFAAPTVEGLMALFGAVLDTVLADPAVRLSALPRGMAPAAATVSIAGAPGSPEQPR
jgi:hypothetical protein